MPSILIVEDETAIADTLIYALESERFSVAHFTTGSEGLNYLQASEPDLVILDIGLPDMTGLDLCREIRRFSQIPVLFLSIKF